MRKIIKLFKTGNVCVTGLRGTGKDLLFGNVIARRKNDYISNINYTNGINYYSLDFNRLDVGKNTYDNFIRNDVNYYSFDYPIGSDIYVSDVGIYYPSQYCNQLNNRYPYMATYQALCRQISHNNFHVNVQNLNRCWDKIREQSDVYIRCKKCIYIFGLVIQFVSIYDKYQSCVDRVPKCLIKIPIFASRETKLNAKMYIEKYRIQYGNVKERILIYFNKSKHDTYYFEKLLKKEV